MGRSNKCCSVIVTWMAHFAPRILPFSKACTPSGNQLNARKQCDLNMFFPLWILTLLFFFSSLCVSLIFVYVYHYKPFPDCLCRLRRPASFLLPGSIYMDVPGGCATLHHAGGGVRERALTPSVLLPGGLRSSCINCGSFSRGGLPQLWHRPSVSTCGASLWAH